jgi:hypothetical protein
LRLSILCCVAATSLLAPRSLAQDQKLAAQPPSGYVTREEYDRLLRDQQSLREELEAMKRERAAEKATAAATTAAATSSVAAAPTTAPSASDADVQSAIRDIRKDIQRLERFRPGFDQFLLAGDMSIEFAALKHADSSFAASISPLILWRPVEKLLVEAGFDIGVSTDPATGESSTSFDLTIANVSYELNDYISIGGGLFIVPFGVFHNHFDPPWIDKLPDAPLPFADGGIAPQSEVGLFVRGAVPVGSMKITYDAYVTNGPQLITKDPGAAGSLNFQDFTDLNGNKAVGGRIGLIPRPDMELGYSIQASEPNPHGFKRVHALLQAVDLNFKPQVDALKGVVDLRTEFVWSDVSDATYDPTGALGFGPARFSNYRQGGYVQLAYRPTLIDNKVLRRFELVGRYDWLNTPLSAPGGDHEHRYEIGIDYWLAPNAVLKAAYEWDHKRNGDDNSGFLAQFGIGL